MQIEIIIDGSPRDPATLTAEEMQQVVLTLHTLVPASYRQAWEANIAEMRK